MLDNKLGHPYSVEVAGLVGEDYEELIRVPAIHCSSKGALVGSVQRFTLYVLSYKRTTWEVHSPSLPCLYFFASYIALDKYTTKKVPSAKIQFGDRSGTFT